MKLTNFNGLWQLSRAITHANGGQAQFEGTANWAPHPDGLFYEEVGQLRIENAQPIKATRSYIWKVGLNIYFPDGRFFHQVPLNGEEAHHNCPPDDYRVRYDFAKWPSFSAKWRVTGPKKDYEMVSIYTRPINASSNG